MVDESTRPEASPWPARVLALVTALLVTAPLLAPGFVLLRDMVFVPQQDLDLDALGLSGALPRAVPADGAMALLTAVLPGSLVQKAVLLGTVYAAVLGAARLVPSGSFLAAAVAGLVYGWSPYLAERLLIGHWTLLLAHAALPWIALAALRLRRAEPLAAARLVLACAPAALTPTGALLAAGTALAAAGLRRAPVAGAMVLVLSLPWLVAGVLHPAGGGSDPAGLAAFAARGENWGGPVVALLGTGGLWNGDAVPDSRASALVPVLTLLLLLLALAGWTGPGGLLVRLGAAGRAMLLLGLGGLVLAAAGAVPGLRTVLEAVLDAVPGAGLLRDGQKWVAWWALPLALGAGLGAARLAGRLHARVGAVAGATVAAVAVLLPVLTVPDLAWGALGRLQPVAYPADWQRVRDVLAATDDPGDVLVLPFGAYRAFDWNDDRPLLDPAPRWLPRPTVVDDTLVVGGRPVEGEDRRAGEVGEAADDPARLAELGIGWVLVEHGTPGRETPAAVADLPVVVDGDELTLHRVPDAAAPPAAEPVRVILVVAAHACALGAVGGALLWIIGRPSTVRPGRRSLRNRITA